jgi:hypothetical protein
MGKRGTKAVALGLSDKAVGFLDASRRENSPIWVFPRSLPRPHAVAVGRAIVPTFPQFTHPHWVGRPTGVGLMPLIGPRVSHTLVLKESN